jgi:tetratricopeptide (TPR) repeat protein
MGRFRAISKLFAPVGLSRALLIFIFILTSLFPLCLRSQDAASLRGAIRDSQGKPVADATVRLQLKESTKIQTADSDSQGNYVFGELSSGVYLLKAEKAGYSAAEISSVFFAPSEAKSIDLTLVSATTPAAAVGQTEFFDQPSFAVAGVKDTTNLGGHGSDTVVRTQESLAKDTASLSRGSVTARNTLPANEEEILRKNAEREPQSFEANYHLGKMLLQNGKAGESIRYLESAATLKPGDYENSYALALANARIGNYQRTRSLAQALLEHLDKAEVHHLLADMQENQGDSLAAVREYQRAAELEPTEAYLFDWGSELLLHHVPEPAAEVFEKGTRLFPHSSRMLIGLGSAWFARGSYQQAVQRICAASDIDPADEVPYLFLGKMQKAEADPSAEVVSKLQRFAAQQPKNAQANFYYALVLWKASRNSRDNATTLQVESLLKNAIRLDPGLSPAYSQLGILHSEQRDYQGALLDYQQAVHADPKSEESHFRLAQTYRQLGDPEKAQAELEFYRQTAKESAQSAERERHEIRQFVYTLRDRPPRALDK